MIPLRRRGWHHPAQGKSLFELSGNLLARRPFFSVPGKSGTPAPAPAAKDGTILKALPQGERLFSR
jgi:hypothetical protein